MNPILWEWCRAIVIVPLYFTALCGCFCTLARGDSLDVFAVHSAYLECGFEGYISCSITIQGNFYSSGITRGGGGANTYASTRDGDCWCSVVIRTTEHIPSAGV